MISISM